MRAPKSLETGGTGSSEAYLRMLLEAASYAIAIEKNCELFRHELDDRLKDLEPSIKLSKRPRFKLVGVAPAAYWIDWLPLIVVSATSLASSLKLRQRI